MWWRGGGGESGRRRTRRVFSLLLLRTPGCKHIRRRMSKIPRAFCLWKAGCKGNDAHTHCVSFFFGTSLLLRSLSAVGDWTLLSVPRSPVSAAPSSGPCAPTTVWANPFAPSASVPAPVALTAPGGGAEGGAAASMGGTEAERRRSTGADTPEAKCRRVRSAVCSFGVAH